MSEFVLRVNEIDEEGSAHAFPVRRSWLKGALRGTDLRADPAAGDGSLEVRVHRSGADIVVRGRVRARVGLTCSRCLGDAALAVDAEVTALLTARGPELRPVPDEVELTPADLERDFFTGDRIVLDDLVREHLLLEVPIKPLCAEDCAGIDVPAEVRGPAPSGALDPRLAPLLALVEASPTEE